MTIYQYFFWEAGIALLVEWHLIHVSSFSAG